jgi:hypothetical protein
MNAKKVFFIAKLILTFAGIMIACACSKKMENSPTAPASQADILVQSGEWFTTGATLVKTDSTSITLAGNDPFLKTILLDNVTFHADGTAIDTNDPNGLTKNGLSWTLHNSHLLVRPNFNNTDKVDAIITYLSYDKLIMNVTDFYVYNGVTYVKLIQTLTH